MGTRFKRNERKIKLLSVTAMFAAIIFVATAFLPRIDLGSAGYLHIGDAFIYLAAGFLPMPYAIASAAIGGCLADLMTGYAIWAPFTLIIKSLLTLSFTNKSKKLISGRNLLACGVALPITTFGYYFSEAIIVTSLTIPLLSLIPNFIQAVGSGVIFIIIAAALERSKLKLFI